MLNCPTILGQTIGSSWLNVKVKKLMEKEAKHGVRNEDATALTRPQGLTLLALRATASRGAECFSSCYVQARKHSLLLNRSAREVALSQWRAPPLRCPPNLHCSSSSKSARMQLSSDIIDVAFVQKQLHSVAKCVHIKSVVA